MMYVKMISLSIYFLCTFCVGNLYAQQLKFDYDFGTQESIRIPAKEEKTLLNIKTNYQPIELKEEYCPNFVMQENSISDVMKSYDVSYCLEKKQSAQAGDNKSLLKAENEVCKCLKAKIHRNETLDAVFSGIQVKSTKEWDDYKKFLNNTKKKISRIKAEQFNLAFDASLVFDAHQGSTEIYKNDFAEKILNHSSESILAETQAHRNASDLTETQKNDANKAISEEILKKHDDASMFGNRLEQNQCVSAREFMAYNQFPDQLVLDELSDPNTSFDPANWTFWRLHIDYKKLMALPEHERVANKKKIETIKSKIVFLNRNPLMKSLLAISEKTKGLDPESIKNARVYQEKLFSSLKDLSKGLKCTSGRDACLFEAVKKGKTKDLKKSLKDIFSNGEVGELVLAQANASTLWNLNHLYDKKELEADLPLSHSALLDDIYYETDGKKNPEVCVDSSSPQIDCISTYGRFCRKLEPLMEKVNLISEDDVVDDLSALMANDYNTSIKTNKSLRDFNELVCNTKRQKNSRDEVGATFFEFKQDYCAKKSKRDICKIDSPANLAKIREKYFDKYDSKDDPAIGFAKFLEKNPIDDMKDIASIVKTSNSNSSSTRDWDRVRKEIGLKAPTPISSPSNTSSKSTVAEIANGFEKAANQIAPSGPEALVNSDSAYHYSSREPASVEKTIQNLTQPEQVDLLNDLNQKLASATKNESNVKNFEQSEIVKNLQAQIEALKAHNSQQKLTSDQYELINEALAAREKKINASNDADSSRTEKETIKFRNRFEHDGSDSIVSSGGSAFNNSGASANFAAGKSGQNFASGSSGSEPRAAHFDSGKSLLASGKYNLALVKDGPNGSITVESVSPGSSQVANAITVPISEDVYLLAQKNPTGLNLSQIEKNIPKDQIAQLEKNGVIILLLQTGSRPPLEVKVRKNKNSLVQVSGTKAQIRRVSTLKQLQNHLKSN